MAKALEPPAPQIVRESFVIVVDGAPIAYMKGDLIEPDDPVIKTWPDKFGPLVYAHPIKRRAVRVALGTPEVRAD